MTQTIVLAALFSASASAIKFRPPVGSVPWTVPLTIPEFESPDHPVNYFVPDFGVDQEIIDATNAIKVSEKALKKDFNASFGFTESTVATPRNYVVPDFGVDKDIKATTASIAQAETAVGSKLEASFGFTDSTVATPRNYFVPNFGVDQGILDAQHSIEISEKKLKHKLQADWGATDSTVGTPRNYVVPDFGVDRDIKWTQGSIKQSEAALKHEWKPVNEGGYWKNMPAAAADSAYVFSNSSPEDSAATKTNGSTAIGAPSKGPAAPADKANLQLEDDPICSSAGCTQYMQPEGPPSHPMDYFVPNFGQDHQVKESINSEEWASADTGHKWVWKNEPKPDIIDYKIEPLDVDMQASLENLKQQEAIHGVWDTSLVELQSDPICSSAGCTQYLSPEGPPSHPMDYFVPDFGVDQDIKDSHNGLKEAEKITKTKWEWKAQPPAIESYPVPDFGVDEEIIRAQDGLKWAQSDLNLKWEPTQDANGFWNVPEAAAASSYSYNGESGFTDHNAGAVY